MDGTFCQLVLYIQGIKLLSVTISHGSHKLYSTFLIFIDLRVCNSDVALFSEILKIMWHIVLPLEFIVDDVNKLTTALDSLLILLKAKKENWLWLSEKMYQPFIKVFTFSKFEKYSKIFFPKI